MGRQTTRVHYVFRALLDARNASDPTPNAVCLDYSIALDDGALCAYRFGGECTAERNNLVWVNRL